MFRDDGDMVVTHQSLAAPPARTRIIATVGPACAESDQLRALADAGVDIFRLNFAHGSHVWLSGVVRAIRAVSAEIGRSIAMLGDLAGPKIRLGTLPADGLFCNAGDEFAFAREPDADNSRQLDCTWDRLVDDVRPGDRVLLADGTVAMRVVSRSDDGESVTCRVEQPGLIRSRQGINLPGVQLSTPGLTQKDRSDLQWAMDNELDFVGLSFVRSADDVRLLRSVIAASASQHVPQIVAKIEKAEAVDDLERILDVTDAVMVARGDLGVEVDITRVPVLQKEIIRACNARRIPVITATQMLDSMQSSELPTRAEASDVANAVLDGTDAVMLSGETAIGEHPVRSVSMMDRICREVEPLVESGRYLDSHNELHARARQVTEAVTLGATAAARKIGADLLVIATHSGRTAMAVSCHRGSVPILALTDQPQTARRVCLHWGVESSVTEAVKGTPGDLLNFVLEWGRDRKRLTSGSRLVLVGSTRWSVEEHDLMVVHVVP